MIRRRHRDAGALPAGTLDAMTARGRFLARPRQRQRGGGRRSVRYPAKCRCACSFRPSQLSHGRGGVMLDYQTSAGSSPFCTTKGCSTAAISGVGSSCTSRRASGCRACLGTDPLNVASSSRGPRHPVDPGAAAAGTGSGADSDAAHHSSSQQYRGAAGGWRLWCNRFRVSSIRLINRVTPAPQLSSCCCRKFVRIKLKRIDLVVRRNARADGHPL